MGQANSSSQPLAAWSALLPESTRPALRHFAALRLIADEPVLMILPFDVRFE